MKKVRSILLLVLSAFFLTACGVKYNAVLYDSVQGGIHAEFLSENLTRNANDLNGFTADDSYPESICYIVKDRKKLDEIFVGTPEKIDLEKEMLVVYFFTCHYMSRSYKLRNISVAAQTLNIEIESVRPKGCFVGDASTPMQRCFAIRMEKLDITEVKVSVKS